MSPGEQLAASEVAALEVEQLAAVEHAAGAMVARPAHWSMIDAAGPNFAVAPAADIVAGYLHSPHAAHGWSGGEWAAAARHSPRIAPIWVAGPPFNAAADAVEIVQQLRGFPLGEIPKGAVVMLDVEHYDAHPAAVGWVDLLAGHFLRDYHVVVYCSATDAHLFARWPLWLGDWTGQPHDIPGAAAVQWLGGGPAWDVSTVFEPLPFWQPSQHTGGPTMQFPGFTVTPKGVGYAQCDSAGRVYCYGDAEFHGGIAIHLGAPIVGMHYTPTGRGYYLVGMDGGVFAFGDAVYDGHAPAPAVHLHPHP